LAADGLFQAHALREILQALAGSGIDVLPLKGISLATRCYGGPGQRKTGDHDLLVRPDQLGQAALRLQEMGFTCRTGAPPPERWLGEGLRLGEHHGPMLVRKIGGTLIAVELHWHLDSSKVDLGLSSPARRTQEVWRRAQKTDLLGSKVWTMAPEDELTYLCLHALRHLAWHDSEFALRLAMLEDIARFARAHPDLDESVLHARSREAGGCYVFEPIAFLWARVIGGSEETVFARPMAFLEEHWGRHSRALLPLKTLMSDTDPPGTRPALGRGYLDKMQRIFLHACLHRSLSARISLLFRELIRPLRIRHALGALRGWGRPVSVEDSPRS
jgi:hypothetical protein